MMCDEILAGGGVVFLSPGGDEGPEGGVGCEDAVVAVAVNAGRRKDGGEAIQELQGREPEGGAAGGIGLLQKVEDLVGAAADEVEAVEGEGAPRAVANEAFEAGTVGGLDADAGVEAEPTAVVPR